MLTFLTSSPIKYGTDKGATLFKGIATSFGDFVSGNVTTIIGILVIAIGLKFGISWAKRLVK